MWIVLWSTTGLQGMEQNEMLGRISKYVQELSLIYSGTHLRMPNLKGNFLVPEWSSGRSKASEEAALSNPPSFLSFLDPFLVRSASVLWLTEPRMPREEGTGEGALLGKWPCPPPSTGSSKRKEANFDEGSSVRADWLCIGCPKLVVSRKEGNSIRGHFYRTSLYVWTWLVSV